MPDTTTTTSAANHLASQRSAYLLSAAHQPVAWYPWSEEAFAKARELDRPILLDIGAVWCHWCHVMDGESYENPETARIINENFIAIKVDRDERPEIDRRYQEAVSAISGQGGWPLTAFLTPDGQVFFGGTYFPPADRYGRKGFTSVLLSVADYYKNKRGDVDSSAARLTQALSRHAEGAQPGPLSPSLVDKGISLITSAFDSVNGGFGSAPKFPHAAAVELLINRQFFSPSPTTEAVIKQTLTGMSRGGVYDQIGGGFHRYSTDERWLVPHFEKMLYDNTELLRNYAMASACFGDSGFGDTARGIIGFLMEVLSDPNHGGFYASQDADVGLHDDGDYFTWTLEEVRAVCSAGEAAVLAERYDITATGEMQHNPAKNVLFVDADLDVIAEKTGKSEDAVRALLQSGAAKLKSARRQRPTPFVDCTIYAGWNGMAISAFLIAADALGDVASETFALKTLDRLLAEAVLPDGRVRHALGSDVPVGLLEDGVFLGRALLDGYERTGRAVYLAAARSIASDLTKRLWDSGSGGFFDHAPSEDGVSAIGLLSQPRKPIQDSPTPAPNAAVAEFLIRLSDATGDAQYRDRAEKQLATFAGAAADLGMFGGTYYLSLDLFLRGSALAVVVGPRGDPAADKLWTAARRTFRPYKSLRRLTDAGATSAASLPPELAAMITSGRTLGYFCAGRTCSLPTDDPKKFAETIATFGRGR